MIRRPVLVFGLAAAAAMLVGSLLLRHVVTRREALVAAERQLAATASSLETVRRLSRQRELVALQQRPTESLIGEVSAVLSGAGLPRGVLDGLANESDAPVLGKGGGVTGLAKQSMRLSLKDLALPDLGAFLHAWRKAGSSWTPSRIELTRRAGGDERYDVAISLTAVYRAEGGTSGAGTRAGR